MALNGETLRPNVIVIIMDDLCWGDLACHGNPHTRTPQLDRLHDQSARLTRYCSGPLCSPARASLLTGRYHPRTRVLDTYCGRSMIDPEEVTLARLLGPQGSRCGAFGKWHLGDCYPLRAMDLGFDETLMHNAGGIGQPGDHYANHFREAECYFDPVLFRNGEAVQTRGYCTDIFTDAALEFIRRPAAEPFFVYLATNAPHTPLIVGDEWADPYRKMGVNETHARLYGMVENIDYNVGRLLATLDERGQAENTIVVYTSDHGPCGSARNPEAPAGRQDRFNAGLRGIKGSMYEGGIRVPCFWRWPGHYSAGRDVDRVAHAIDVFPTLAAAAQAPLPETIIDGADLTPLLTGQTPAEAWPARSIFMQWHRGDVPVRHRNYAVIEQDCKLVRPHETNADELYDLAADPAESRDLASERPETVARLRAAYETWLDDLGATRGPGTFDQPLIHIGNPREPVTMLNQNDWRVIGPEGWRTDDIRGYWDVQVESAGEYEVTLRFRQDIESGRAVVLCGETRGELAAAAGEWLCRWPALNLAAGRQRVEAWRELDSPLPTAFRGRYVPALWVELKRLAE